MISIKMSMILLLLIIIEEVIEPSYLIYIHQGPQVVITWRQYLTQMINGYKF